MSTEEDSDDVLVYGNNGRLIKARTKNQEKLVRAYEKNDLIFAEGPAGTGKTYTAIALAVRALKNKEIKRIILTRPAVEAGEQLGFLPGDMKEKLDPYLQPLYDALRDMIPAKKLELFMEEGVVQIAPLAYMRGRTLDNACVILDEAQNTSLSQLKMFLTRMGADAKFIVTGDTTQIDLPRTNRPIVFYGTSITQGGCASRPGMAYPAIIGRKLQRQTINLGFSGNARMDASVGELLISIDAGIYFIDCLANCTADLVRARGYSFIKALLDAKPDIPVIMVSHQLEPKARFSRPLENNLKEINRLWEEIYQRLLAEGYNQLRFIPADNLTGHDGESTVDGAHLTDLGFLRIAEELIRYCNQ